MATVIVALQVVIALVIVYVWLYKFGKQSNYRGGDAKDMKEEFQVYGLPGWFLSVVGFFKILFAALLIVGIWRPSVIQPAAIGLAVLMLGAVAMHFKVKDPLKKAAPAFTMLALCLIVAFA